MNNRFKNNKNSELKNRPHGSTSKNGEWDKRVHTTKFTDEKKKGTSFIESLKRRKVFYI